MATATAMYHTQQNPLRGARPVGGEAVVVPKGLKVRRLHKAFLRYHDPNNWPLLRETLRRMGRADLIGPAKHQLIPAWQPPAPARCAKGPGRAVTCASTAARVRDRSVRSTGLPSAPAASDRRATAGASARRAGPAPPATGRCAARRAAAREGRGVTSRVPASVHAWY